MWLWLIAKEPNNKVWNVMIEQQAQERWLFLLHEISWELRHDHAFIITKKRRRIDDDNKKRRRKSSRWPSYFVTHCSMPTRHANKTNTQKFPMSQSLAWTFDDEISSTQQQLPSSGWKKKVNFNFEVFCVMDMSREENWMNEWTRLMAWKLCERDNIIFPSWDEMKCT